MFTDVDEEPGRHTGAAGPGGASRRISVPERIQGSEKPRGSSQVSHKRRRISSHGQSSPSGLDELALSQIRDLFEAGNATVIHKLDILEAKLESFEKRLDVLEHEGFETATKAKTLEKTVAELKQENKALRDQIESVDTNNRQDSLILKCEEFGRRTLNEDIEEKAIGSLNSRFDWLRLSRGDLQVAHRLNSDNTVICKFLRRSTRDRIYDSRFEQKRTETGHKMYITESLSAPKREIMNALIAAKKQGHIYTCFSRKGYPFVKDTPSSSGRRVTSLEQVRPYLDAPLPRPQVPPGPPGPRSVGRGGRGGARGGGRGGGRAPPGAGREDRSLPGDVSGGPGGDRVSSADVVPTAAAAASGGTRLRDPATADGAGPADGGPPLFGIAPLPLPSQPPAPEPGTVPAGAGDVPAGPDVRDGDGSGAAAMPVPSAR